MGCVVKDRILDRELPMHAARLGVAAHRAGNMNSRRFQMVSNF